VATVCRLAYGCIHEAVFQAGVTLGVFVDEYCALRTQPQQFGDHHDYQLQSFLS
jgi:hypothetical protein